MNAAPLQSNMILLLFRITATTVFIPSYGNLTNGGAMVRFYGLSYEKKDSVDNSFSSFVDSTIFTKLKDDVNSDDEKNNLTTNTNPFFSWEMNKQKEIGINGPNNNQIRVKTGDDGKFDQFVNVTGVSEGIFNFTEIGQNNIGQVFISNETGIGIITDVDDVLRVVEIWNPHSLLLYTFARPFNLVTGAQDLFWKWSRTLSNVSFHYSSEAPILMAPSYTDLIKFHFPLGSLDLRPMDQNDISGIFTARKDNTERIFQTYPRRKFILIGDTSINNIVPPYTDIAKTYPDQILCIFIRNVTADYPTAINPLVNLVKSFDGVPNEKWFVYDNLSNIKDLDVENGECHPKGKEGQQTWSGGWAGVSGDANYGYCGMLLILINLNLF